LRVVKEALEVEAADELGCRDFILVHDVFGSGLAGFCQDRFAGLVEHRHFFARDLDLLLDLEKCDVEGIAERENGEGENPDHRRQQK